jgi:hypothetical protein
MRSPWGGSIWEWRAFSTDKEAPAFPRKPLGELSSVALTREPPGMRYALAATISGSSLDADAKTGPRIMVGCMHIFVSAVEHLEHPNASNCATGETSATTTIIHQPLTSCNEQRMPSPLSNM